MPYGRQSRPAKTPCRSSTPLSIAAVRASHAARLAEVLRHPAGRKVAADVIRGLIEKVTLSPGAKHGQLEATLYGDLGTILTWTAHNAAIRGNFASAPPQRAHGDDSSVLHFGVGTETGDILNINTAVMSFHTQF
jgi:hypothetical protein